MVPCRSREEPHALILIAAVNNVDAVAHNCVMKSGAGILSNEPKKFPAMDRLRNERFRFRAP